MAEGKKGKGVAKKRSLLDRIRSLITEDSDSKIPTGTGGRKRERSIMNAVDAMQSGIDDADKDSKRKK